MNPGFPKPSAATQGTIVLAEDLFYNVPLRKKALKSASEEYNAILDVAGKYGLFKSGVAVVVKRAGVARCDLATLEGSSRQDNIRVIYGSNVAKNVLPISLKCGDFAAKGPKPSFEPSNSAVDGQEDRTIGSPMSSELRCYIDGFITGADYAGKQTQLILFINGRSVDCPPMKRCLESTYASLLPKAAKPWAFLDVRMPGGDVDVNVHPTKKEVAFLYQEEMIEKLRLAVEEVLLASNSQRSFKQAMLPGVLPAVPMEDVTPSRNLSQAYRPNSMVRNDAKMQSLDAFIRHSQAVESRQALVSSVDEAKSAGDREGESAPEDIKSQKNTVDVFHDNKSETQNGASAYQAALGSLDMPQRRRGFGISSGAVTGDAAYLPTPMEIAGNVRSTMPWSKLEEGTNVSENDNAREGSEAGGRGNQATIIDANVKDADQSLGQAPRRTLKLPSQQECAFNTAGKRRLEIAQNLMNKIKDNTHEGLSDMFRAPIYVGLADPRRALIQSGTRLYLMDLSQLSSDLFYQRVLKNLGQLPKLFLEPPLPVRELALTALEIEELAGNWTQTDEDETKEDIADLLQELLIQKSQILSECFSINVSSEGMLETLPLLLDGYEPSEIRLPGFILGLGHGVEWKDEESYVNDISRLLSDLYSLPDEDVEEEVEVAEVIKDQRGTEDCGDQRLQTKCNDDRAEVCTEKKRDDNGYCEIDPELEKVVAHVLIPALRTFWVPTRDRASDGSIVELTRLEQLYKVFERC